MKLVRRYAVGLVLLAAAGGYLYMGLYNVRPDEQAQSQPTRIEVRETVPR